MPAAPIRSAVSQSSGRVDAPTNGLIAFSTAPGTEPFDGKGRNSPYATALLKHIVDPGPRRSSRCSSGCA